MFEPLTYGRGGDEEQERRDNRNLRDERMGRDERSGRAPVGQDGAQGLEDAAHAGQNRRVEMTPALGQFAQPDRGEVRLGDGLAGDGVDELTDLERRRLIGVAPGRDGIADGIEQLAQDLAVEARFAAEVVVEHRLVDAGLGGDAVDLGAVESARRKFLRRRRQQAGPGSRRALD